MSEIELAKWVIMAALGGVIYFMKKTQDTNEHRIDELERAQQKIKDDYLHKSEFKDFKLELRGMFEEIKTDIRSLRQPHV
jgi:hypothetical protein